ncbi:uncharacterized protein J4E88_002738 [Alternaria novae-zelandiae]|uniref:uncharacterized protein n=1 Tax=Alternaria novae-zelandiae TaxID=430562 RepID=UPI0020C408B1|nr:uncharacterized protein J4E88_002738 [Alternaria novae-zelandiae]KAI4689386.1 hypothetical protein J4E88_002738 [Alternaria novae-zelandiae]
MIAISANTHQITIVAFALASDSELEAPDHGTNPGFPYSRREDSIFTLQATNNVPAVSFYGDSGRWLLSSCIDGKTSMWDLYTKKEVATFQLGWCASASDLSKPPRYISHRFLCDCPGAQNVLHGAWGTIALDTRSAYELPLDEGMTASSTCSSRDFLDISDQKTRFKVSETTSHQYHPDTDDEEDSTDDEEIEVVSEANETDNDEEDIDPNHQLLGMTFEELAQSFGISETLLSSIRPGTLRSPNRAPYRLIDDLRPIAEHMGGPFLIFTKEDIFLIQGLSATSLNVPLDPIVAIRRPLHPGRWVDSLMSCDRHCFFSQIPELGIFIVGSPAGRVGVFSLYYTRDKNTGEPRHV